MKPSLRIKEIYEDLQKTLGDKGDAVTAIIQFLDEEFEKNKPGSFKCSVCGYYCKDCCSCI